MHRKYSYERMNMCSSELFISSKMADGEILIKNFTEVTNKEGTIWTAKILRIHRVPIAITHPISKAIGDLGNASDFRVHPRHFHAQITDLSLFGMNLPRYYMNCTMTLCILWTLRAFSSLNRICRHSKWIRKRGNIRGFRDIDNRRIMQETKRSERK